MVVEVVSYLGLVSNDITFSVSPDNMQELISLFDSGVSLNHISNSETKLTVQPFD